MGSSDLKKRSANADGKEHPRIDNFVNFMGEYMLIRLTHTNAEDH